MKDEPTITVRFNDLVMEFLSEQVFRDALGAKGITELDRDSINKAFDNPLIFKIPEIDHEKDMVVVDMKEAEKDGYIKIDGDEVVLEAMKLWSFTWEEKGKAYFFPIIKKLLVKKLQLITKGIKQIENISLDEYKKRTEDLQKKLDKLETK